jgi:hypothetical protein
MGPERFGLDVVEASAKVPASGSKQERDLSAGHKGVGITTVFAFGVRST